MGASESYWSSYMLQMLAVKCARLSGRHELAAEYLEIAKEYIDLHFEAIDKHLNDLTEFNNG